MQQRKSIRGCGHSIHMQCNLPNISVCQEIDDDKENSDDYDNLKSDEDNSNVETSIDDPISRIGSWAHILPPRN